MTYQEALNEGYVWAETSIRRGYVSRKIDIYSQPVKEAGGRKKGRLYVDFPSWRSTGYHTRQYLIKPFERL